MGAITPTQKIDYHVWVYGDDTPLGALPPKTPLHCTGCLVDLDTRNIFIASLPADLQAPGKIPGQVAIS